MDVVELHDRCVEEFLSRVRQVRDDQWDRRTPCPEWTVRELVNHIVGERLWTVPMMAGATIEQVGDRFAGDVLGADPVTTTEHAARAAQAAVVEPVLAGRITHLSFGDTPAEEYTRQLAADHLVHAWDLAVSIGADSRLPGELVEAVAGWFTERERWYRAGGAIVERPAATDHGDPRRRLLIAFGRDPDWTPTLAAVHAFNAAFAAADVDAIMALVTEDCVFESTGPAPDGERHIGAGAVREVWQRLLSTARQPRFEWDEVLACGTRRAVVRWRFGWLEDDGTPGHVRGVDLLAVRDGKVAEKLSYVKG